MTTFKLAKTRLLFLEKKVRNKERNKKKSHKEKKLLYETAVFAVNFSMY